jgi:hypothetical protein
MARHVGRRDQDLILGDPKVDQAIHLGQDEEAAAFLGVNLGQLPVEILGEDFVHPPLGVLRSLADDL